MSEQPHESLKEFDRKLAKLVAEAYPDPAKRLNAARAIVNEVADILRGSSYLHVENGQVSSDGTVDSIIISLKSLRRPPKEQTATIKIQANDEGIGIRPVQPDELNVQAISLEYDAVDCVFVDGVQGTLTAVFDAFSEYAHDEISPPIKARRR